MALPKHLVIITLASLPAEVSANNGLNFIGFGSESLNMGGADIAVARDTTALNTNPAGMGQIEHARVDQYATISYALDTGHRDQLGNDAQTSRKITPSGGIGFAIRPAHSKYTFGVGGFIQGGAGNKFDNLLTAFGTRDELSAEVGLVKLSPGIAYEFSNGLRVGAVMAFVVGTLEQKVFPNTSTPVFSGFRVEDMRAMEPSLRFGFQYDLTVDLTVAAVYAPKVELTFEDGEVVTNLTAAGLGNVTYRKARIEGLALPQEIGVGVGWSALRSLISVKVSWLNWNDALNGQRLIATDPDNALAPNIDRTTRLDWDDQYVVAIGIAYQYNERTTYYAGFNYGNNPVPETTLSPLFSPAIAQKHVTAGAAHEFPSSGFKLYGGLLYVLPEKVTYSNAALPFGANARERIEYFGLNLMLSKIW
jgi:long-chain fatty acid transport protein